MTGPDLRETAAPSSSATSETLAYSPGELGVLRDITRGGLAGLIVGVALAGIGGRLVMGSSRS